MCHNIISDGSRDFQRGGDRLTIVIFSVQSGTRDFTFKIVSKRYMYFIGTTSYCTGIVITNHEQNVTVMF